LNIILEKITDFNTFKEVLEQVWSQDSSLLSYFYGMDDSELKEFFNRKKIQNIILDKIPEEKRIPSVVIQIKKKTRRLFRGKIKIKKTGKIKSVFAKEDKIKIKGKKRQIYRDSKGRFVKIPKKISKT